jgi:sterol desaturase/sphingolipid hydroxylase (fatty acid hydroxylase superfamily)
MIGLYHYAALGVFGGFAALDVVRRGQFWPEVAAWKATGALCFILYFAGATFAPLMWDAWLGQHQIVDASRLPFWAQVAGGFLLLELGIYAWHRTMHKVPFLWRWFHQMHHSAERLDIWGAYYFHPFDMLGWALLGSLVLVGGFGLGGEAALVVNLLALPLGMIQHANIRTPRWLGYFVQRPESHSLHHKRGHHANNYGDLPLFDMIFGTFANPTAFEPRLGFHEGASRQLGEMLRGKAIA